MTVGVGKFQFHSEFEIGTRVLFDGHRDIIARITAVQFATNYYPKHYLEWTHNGSLVGAWVDEWRLTLP